MRCLKRGRYRYLLFLALCSFCMWSVLFSNQPLSKREVISAIDDVNLTGVHPMDTTTRETPDISSNITTLPQFYNDSSVEPTSNISRPSREEVVWKDAILLAGNENRQGLLTIGIPTVARPNASYLHQTLKSIITNMSVKERQQVVCVIFLSGNNATYSDQLALNLSQYFPSYLQDGFIRLITAPEEYYPSLDSLKQTYNDKPERVRWRSKQNLDYAFLINYSKNISTYYLQIEDDVLPSQDFFGKIMLFIKKQTKEWAMLDFSGKGFIGKLFKSRDLTKLALLLRVFFNEQPCDFLINYFSSLLIQPKAIVRKPALFKHIGYYSSLRNQIRALDGPSSTNNPEASLNTTIETYLKHYLSNVYRSNTKFWGKQPHRGDRVDIMFKNPQNISKHITIQTGDSKKPTQDRVKGAKLEAGTGSINPSGVGCQAYIHLGNFKDGSISYSDKSVLRNIRCLRITLTEDQEDWIIIRKIQIAR